MHKCTHSITVKCENVQSNASQISSVRPNVHRELDSWMQHENNISGLACFSSTIYCNNARRWCIFSSWHSNIVYQKTIEEIMMWFSRHNRSVTQLKKKGTICKLWHENLLELRLTSQSNLYNTMNNLAPEFEFWKQLASNLRDTAK